MSRRPKKAVALKYKSGQDNVPKVTAKGTGLIAEKIIAVARKQGIPVKDDPNLIEVLSRLDLDQEIPPELYVVVAELLAFVYSLNRKKRLKVGRIFPHQAIVIVYRRPQSTHTSFLFIFSLLLIGDR